MRIRATKKCSVEVENSDCLGDGSSSLAIGGKMNKTELSGSTKQEALGQGSTHLQLRSFCDVDRVARVIYSFDETKKRLVRSMGFDGLLRMPLVKRLDDKFSLWLMRHLDPEKMVLVLPNGDSLALSDLDAHFVLGIPFKGSQVFHDKKCDKEIANTVVSKLGGGHSDDTLTLDYLEQILAKDYGGNWLPEEKLAFKIAVVLYSMACILAVQSPMDCFPVWLLRNFIDPREIDEFNWCGYVLSVLANGARIVQSQLKVGADSIDMYGCTFLLQVMYLDNLNFGPSTPVLMDLPRGMVYKEDFLSHLIELDQQKDSAPEHGGYGSHKLRVAAEVCYGRGWAGRVPNEFREYDESYLSAADIFHQVMQFNEELAAQVAPMLCRLSALTATDIWETYREWYPGYKVVFSPLPADTFSDVHEGNDDIHKGKAIVSGNSLPGAAPDQGNEALTMLATEASKCYVSPKKRLSMGVLGPGKGKRAKKIVVPAMKRSGVSQHTTQFILESGVIKKLVTCHSNFGKSPFELGRYTHCISWRKKVAILEWIESPTEGWGDLTRIWVHLEYPVPISLLGYNLKTQFCHDGAFTTSMVDAITRTSIHADDAAYGAVDRRWRHFLPSRFAEVVLNRENYLDSYEIKAHFTGKHIKYHVENCRMISAPVLYQGRWSCYFWDFMSRQVTVLDPTRMHMEPEHVEMHHGDIADILTKGLFACIARFFSGWNFDNKEWKMVFPTNKGPHCEIFDSGLYTILYSRYFDGCSLICSPRQGVLMEPRPAMLYYLLFTKGNRGYIPQHVKDMIFKIK